MSLTNRDQSAPAAQSSPQPVFFTVAWTGGVEDPIYASFTNEAAAQAKFEEWKGDSGHVSDRIDIIRHTLLSDGTITNAKVDSWSKWANDED